MEKIVLIVLFFCTILISSLILCVSNQKKRQQIRLDSLKFQMLDENYNNLMEMYQQKVSFLHDVRNHMRLIGQLAQEAKDTKVINYLKDMEGTLKRYGNVAVTGSKILDLILNIKEQEAHEQDIAFHFFFDSMSGMQMKETDICSLFSNILDNAIEANKKLPVESRSISLSCARRREMLFIEIKNPVEEAIRIEMGIPVTTKQEKVIHGYGFRIIRKIVDTYDGSWKVECTDKQFCLFMSLNVFTPDEV